MSNPKTAEECERIQAQHQLFAGICAHLRSAIVAGTHQSPLLETVESLWAYMAAHFATEEHLMVETDYPELQQHRMAHAFALSELHRLDDVCRVGDTAAAEDILAIIEEWEVSHVAVADREMLDHLKH